jgi:polygalacturonase
MRELGADVTGKVLCTSLINGSIERASLEGGGTIYFPAGVYLTGSIELRSNITLHLESGSVLRFSDDFSDYLPFVEMRWEGVVMRSFRPLFHAVDAANLTICGRGKVDGQGYKWWQEHHRLSGTLDRSVPADSLTTYQKLWSEENVGLEVSPYYERSLRRKFFRPPCIQFFRCRDILIEGITIVDSPFWTVNPEFCDNVTVTGITIVNDADSPNTDGINPSSCSNVHISNCHIDVGDDCITIKSGRDADGRRWGRACENITITNCTMLAGHGGVVIGSEMSGSVRRVTISNCIFDGTDAGIRLKSSRGRGGIVEEIRVNNIVMHNIRKNAFIFDLFYDRESAVEPVSERTPVFRNVHISNVTGSGIKKVGYILGIEEMPIENISFSGINMLAEEGFSATTARDLRFHDVDFAVSRGSSFEFSDCADVVLRDIRSSRPISDAAIVKLRNVRDIYISECRPASGTAIFCDRDSSEVIWGANSFDHVSKREVVRHER